jgi:hypothetical protein
VKDGERPAPQVVDFAQIVVRDGAEGEPVTSLRVAGFSADDDESEARPKVRAADVLIEALRDAGDGGLRFADARTALSKADSTTSEALKRLVESGQVSPSSTTAARSAGAADRGGTSDPFCSSRWARRSFGCSVRGSL